MAYIRDQINHAGFTYYFRMTNHLLDPTLGGVNTAMRQISEYIHNNWNNLVRVGNNRFYVSINQFANTRDLFQLLDANSRQAANSYLTFFERDDGQIQVDHFGPFGEKTNREIENQFDESEKRARLRKQKEEQQRQRQIIQKRIQKVLNNPEEMKTQFPELNALNLKKKQLEQLLLSLQERKKKLNQNQKIALQSLGLALKASKLIAEEIAKLTAKQSVKIGAKKIPIVGFIAGLGFGIFRAVQGDWAGAAGQVASGAASTIPGPGTAVSLAIDAGLLTKDIIDQKDKADKQLQIANKEKAKIEAQLKQVQMQIQKTKKELDILESKPLKQYNIIEIENLKNNLAQIDNRIRKLTFQIDQQENKDFIKEFAQLPFVHHDKFSFSSDQQFIENIKEFKRVIEPAEKKISAQTADKNEAIAIILAFIIPSGFDKKANLSDLLFSANLKKEEVRLIMQALPQLTNDILKVNSAAVLQNQLFLIEEKQNGQKAICSKYGIKVYLSAINGQGSIYANKIFCNGWQKFFIQDLKNQRCAIKTLSGYYLNSDLKAGITASSKVVNENSTFELIRLKDGSVAFRDSSYFYLSIPTLIKKQ